MGRSTEYYRKNKEAREKKKKYDTEFNKKLEQRKKRAELIKKNREADKRGVDRDGKDYDHAAGRYVDKSINRGRSGNDGGPATAGDKRARGKKSKK